MAASGLKKSENIEKKVFVVTGGAVGVGAGIVKALLTENAAHVAYLDIREREGEALEVELSRKFGALRAKFIKCDIADERQLSAAFTQVIDKYRRLDGVINNAAVLNTDETQYFKKIIDVNFTATIQSSLVALDLMRTDKGGAGGTILNISSLRALRGDSQLPVYAATKTAVLHFSNSIGGKQHNKKTNVKVMTVCLGPTDTAILHRNSLTEDKDSSFTSHADERQRVESAVTGIIEVIRGGQSGTTWMVSNDNPAVDITKNVNESYEVLSKGVNDLLLGP
ncbi:15-hydroxyprostaglandin dehydrogenase [NAD(+)]-like [Leguminivora glycinivorella]|uniref:15-hydroxyprostaglandin dehydrogenase [NAD(+)]-like n=1 Tax=Leguminivora glycinivorella TaxID=1035111 RepID=UPI00200F2885|nr:15-hydroxyprostaglandin dehydrogenase [NAD(+)]-like [Leguminivora glycinivorella]